MSTEQTAPGRRLVVVSNRLPFRAERKGSALTFTRSPGGLVSALEPALHERGGTWIGWPGIPQEDLEAARSTRFPHDGNVRYAPVDLSAAEVSAYYGGFSNRTLWPLFHYFVSRTTIDAATWRVYDAVNERFAQAAEPHATRDALVWVHDYQLLRVPYHLRRLAPESRVAFFLHIPFPATDVLRVLPWARLLLRGMLGADYVAFHVDAYARHFLDAAERLLGCEVDHAARTVQFEAREVSVGVQPISIDVDAVVALAGRGGPRLRTGDRSREILGVDRLDYTKGIPERLAAVERLFERHPEYRGRVAFTQVLVPSRERVAEYSQLKRQLDEMVGRINGRFSEPGWVPIRYLVRSLPPDRLMRMYRDADVALVTPLRDGMNLVAKEYVMAQVHHAGVLVLSELAGAAEELQEALIVNPFDVDAVADALHRALAMSDDERRTRMAALRDRVRSHDVHAWVRGFLAAAERAHAAAARSPSPLDTVRRRLGPWLAERRSVAVFLDYDGTLTPIAPRPADAVLSDQAREVLLQAARNPALDVAIVSGRALADVKQMVNVPGLTYVGDHGFTIEGPGLTFQHEALADTAAALDRASQALAALDVPGAWVERKAATLALHLRHVADADVRRVERDAERILRRLGLHTLRGKRIVEGRPPVEWHKGRAVLYLLARRHGADWASRVRALYIGDDVTDEDAFESLHGIGRSICVAAPAHTSTADLRLPDPDAVIQLLRWLAAGGFAASAG